MFPASPRKGRRTTGRRSCCRIRQLCRPTPLARKKCRIGSQPISGSCLPGRSSPRPCLWNESWPCWTRKEVFPTFLSRRESWQAPTGARAERHRKGKRGGIWSGRCFWPGRGPSSRGQAYNLNISDEIAHPARVAHAESRGQPRVGCGGPALHFSGDTDLPCCRLGRAVDLAARFARPAHLADFASVSLPARRTGEVNQMITFPPSGMRCLVRNLPEFR